MSYPTDQKSIDILTQNGYFTEKFYIDIYSIFMSFGWKLENNNLKKVNKDLFPYESIGNILEFLYVSNQKYFLNLFYLSICQDMFNYAKKTFITWDMFKNFLKYSSITVGDFPFVRYRWDTTKVYTRNYLRDILPNNYRNQYMNVVSGNETMMEMQLVTPTDFLNSNVPTSLGKSMNIKLETTPLAYNFHTLQKWRVYRQDDIPKNLYNLFLTYKYMLEIKISQII